MWGLVEHFMNALFPPLCRVCRCGLTPPFDASRVCDACLRKIRLLQPPYCPTCGRPVATDALSPRLKTCEGCPPTKIYFDMARAWLEYGGVTADLIKLLKFRYKKDILPMLVDFLLRAYEDQYKEISFDLIMPVPLHWMRLRYREFNQSELLATALGGTVGVDVELEALCRIRRTPPQAQQSRDKRYSNVRGAFDVVVPEAVHGKSILMVDDVYTTGTTVNECARVLKLAGASRVYILTIARAL